jgi:CHAT domain-containing protein/tetratricopeptide (TPR) repeat protein
MPFSDIGSLLRWAFIGLALVLARMDSAIAQRAPDSAEDANRQAMDFYRQGNIAQAELLYMRALAIRQKTLNPNDPAIAVILNNLAELYQDRGRFSEAEPLLRRALEIWENALGSRHPAVATGEKSLIDMYLQSVGSDRRGADFAGGLGNLAALYMAEGRFDDAEPLLRRALTVMVDALGPDHRKVATALNNLATLQLELGRYDEAERLLTRANTIAERTANGDASDAATSLGNLAVVYEAQGRYGKAELLLQRALTLEDRAASAPSNLAHTLNNLAEHFQNGGRMVEAEELLKRALKIREQALGSEHPDVASSLNNLADLYLDEYRYADAGRLYQRALAIETKQLDPEHPIAVASLRGMATLYEAQGRYAEAEPLKRRVLASKQRAYGEDHPAVAASLNNLAGLLEKEGRYAEATPLMLRGLSITEAALGPDHPEVVKSLTNLAALYIRQGRYVDAEPLAQRALAIAENRRPSSKAEPTVSVAAQRTTTWDPATTFIGMAEGEAESATGLYCGSGGRGMVAMDTFRAAQLPQVSDTANAITSMAARFVAGNDTLAATVRERQDLVSRWRSLDAMIVLAVSRPPAERKPEQDAALRFEISAVKQRIDAIDERISREFPDFGELSNPRPVTARAVQSLLAPNEAMLVYLSAANATWLWMVSRDRVTLFHISISATDIEGAVRALRVGLDPVLNPNMKPFPATLAYALYQRLVAPAVSELPGVNHLLIVPGQLLDGLPFAVLVTQRPAEDPADFAGHRDIAWLARTKAITILPSVSTLAALHASTATVAAALPFLGIGDPVLQERVPSEVRPAALYPGSIPDIQQVRKLPALPETAVELRTIGRILGASGDDLLLGDRATEPMLRKMPLDRYRVIEFATHGLMSGELKGLAEPALILTLPQIPTAENDELLTASKIATLRLNADWVVLSACNTAAGDGTPGADRLSGLAKAFFYAGAHALLVSQWPVMSRATVPLVTGTFAELANDPAIGRAEALRRAMMRMMDLTNPPEFAHPTAWAPFMLVGDGWSRGLPAR